MDNYNRNTPSQRSNEENGDQQNMQNDHQHENRKKLWWTEEEVARRGKIKPGRPEDTMMEDRPTFPE